MIANERELQTTTERIAWFQQQLAYLRRTEANPVNYRAAACGFLAEIDRMQLEVREYFSFLPAVGTESPNQAPRQTAAAFSASREFTMLGAAAAADLDRSAAEADSSSRPRGAMHFPGPACLHRRGG